MSDDVDVEGPYIVWVDYGYDGWQPRSFKTLKEALEDKCYGNGTVITKLVKYDVVELKEEKYATLPIR